jgi:hypothetical protein
MKTVSYQELLRALPGAAAGEDIMLLNGDKPAGFVHVFSDEEEADDYLLENDDRFLARVAESRAEFRAGNGIPLDEVKRILSAG